MSKGAKGEKSLKKMINKEKLGNDEKYTHIGEIEINHHVKVYLNDELRICKVIAARPINKKDEHIKDEIQNENDFEFYVHYIDFDRRNDHWIRRSDIVEAHVNEDEIKKKQIINDEDIEFKNNENEGMDKAGIKVHEEATKIRTIEQIVFGNHITKTWYFSPFPEEYQNHTTIYFCDFCLSFFAERNELIRHVTTNCFLKHPPGNEIYRDDKISVFEVDGKTESVFCENLGYLSKLFLDHKTLQWDLDPFLFYVLTEYDKYGYHFVGYFSKEKESPHNWNLSCILTMPFNQRKGYGKFLIDFSYLLSKKEDKFGTPERPLSDLGFSTYYAYWTQKICEVLKNWKEDTITINDISKETQIMTKDIQKVMSELNLLRYHEGSFIVVSDKKILEQIESKTGRLGYPLHKEKLIWTPYKNKYDI